MLNTAVREAVMRVLPRVKTPAQYTGGELHSVPKNHRHVRGKVCLCFPDAYTLGMSHHGFQVLYTIMNNDPQWACERAFAPWLDFEGELRRNRLPLYGLETFTPLSEFDIIGFSLQYEVCYTNLLTMIDLGGVPLFSNERMVSDPLVIAGGPGAQNPELLAPFVDLFVIGDGEESLPWVMEKWMALKEVAIRDGDLTHKRRMEMLAELVGSTKWAYAPAFYVFDYHADGTIAAVNRTRSDVPAQIESCTITQDLDSIPLPTKPVVSFVQTPHDRIAIEIMRGCPWQCRFCQSTVIKRPLRVRSVETIVQAALDSYRNTGMNEISLLSLSSSDYPHFEELVRRMHEVFGPLGVNVSLPSLRVNHQLRSVPQLMQGWRRAGLTLAPEVARDDMRTQIRKPIKNDDLIEGCREAFKAGMSHVKLYFLCGLPGERSVDLDGIVELAEAISEVGKQATGRYKEVTASVSNFIPKPHTPYQWNGMQSREYFRWAGDYLHRQKRNKWVKIKQHDVETSLLEGILTRGDRRVAPGLHEAWRRGARFDGWKECFRPELWWKSFADMGIDVDFYRSRQRPIGEKLPWDHVNVKKGRAYLEKEQERSVIQLRVMAEAVSGEGGEGGQSPTGCGG
ncbi:Radical SAM superfamily protein [Gemmata sp. SH-PL17]|uniref:TIGR03960 family B12-binding radical SAM protein n=1 Tax=Gemmata sp. SH-PL17 TaxID=1630693 RepID=UPI00078E5A07|nr:TIGR03960 family B12-binding radical SAM protein [Gemmata sp. SH-PL17]AMV26535.1 Radical SAM superfamily protein [Gemmata sp. SH-PL17]